MFKKTTLVMIASASMLLAAPAADNSPNMMPGKGMGQGGGKAAMMSQGKCGQGMQRMKGNKKRMHGKRNKRMMHSPFLIKNGLPHMSMLVMHSWNDPAFGLTDEQKSTLEGIRKKTMGSVMNIKKEILPLTKEIISGTLSGKTADELKDKVKKLGELEAEATIVQIQCIGETKKVLTKDQLIYLLQKSMQRKNMMKKAGPRI